MHSVAQSISLLEISQIESPTSYCIEQAADSWNLYFQLERYNTNLEEIINFRKSQQNFFSTKEMQSLVKVIFTALDKLEQNNIPFACLRPSNILQNKQQVYRLVDAGMPSQNKKNKQYYDAPEKLTQNATVTNKQYQEIN